MALIQDKTKEPELEIIEDEDEDGLDVLVQSVSENSNSGFRRAGPATYAEKAKNDDGKKATAVNDNKQFNDAKPRNNENQRSHNIAKKSG